MMRWKRLFDLAASGLAGLVFAPAVGAIAIAIAASERRDVLFRQARIGLRREPFTVLKLRTMHEGEVTWLGAPLRQTGIDEVLQFLNVVRGEMHVVGPRPLTEDDVARLGWSSEVYDWRWELRPGITGLAQLFGEDARSSLALDRAYLDAATPRLDAELVALSFVVNLVGKRRGRHIARALPTRARALAQTVVERDGT